MFYDPKLLYEVVDEPNWLKFCILLIAALVCALCCNISYSFNSLVILKYMVCWFTFWCFHQSVRLTQNFFWKIFYSKTLLEWLNGSRLLTTNCLWLDDNAERVLLCVLRSSRLSMWCVMWQLCSSGHQKEDHINKHSLTHIAVDCMCILTHTLTCMCIWFWHCTCTKLHQGHALSHTHPASFTWFKCSLEFSLFFFLVWIFAANANLGQLKPKYIHA